MANKRTFIGDMGEVPGKTQAKACQPCCRKNVNNVAEIFCEDCGEYQCIECSKVHEHFPVMAAHKMINKSDVNFLSQRYDMKGADLGKQHREILKFLCEDDNKLCCSTCAIVNHRKCQSVVEIKEKAKVESPEFSSLKHFLLDIDSKTKMFQKRMSETGELLVNGEQEILGQIQEVQDTVHKTFEELKRKVLRDISTFKKQAMRDLSTNVASCDNYIADVDQYLSDIANVTELGTPIQQIIMFYYLKDQVRQLQHNTTKNMEEFKDVRMTFDFDDFFKLPPTMSAMPGRLTVEYRTACDRQSDSKDKQHKDQKVILKLLGSIDLKQGEDDMGEPFYTGLDFLPDGRLVTVDNKNKKCLVYNEQLQLTGSFALPDISQDVVAVSGEEVAITTGTARNIHFLDVKVNHKVSLKESKYVTNNYDSVSLIDNENFAIGTTNDPQPVRVVSVSGEEKELGINIPTKTYSLGDSKCTYIQKCNKVVLSDRYAHTVYIYDIASNTSMEVKDEKIIKEPRSVAVGPGDCIFVCSNKTNTLVQISDSGQILSSHVLDMKYPFSVSVSKDYTKIAVSNSCVGQRKLQLFCIDIK